MKNTRNNESGMALLMTLFALVVLSVIGLGMMSATNMETSINRNYRDKQGVFYAVQSGLQEARDRINPATHNITAPTALPSLTAANVIYIINPRGSETVAPWDINNAYADTELCQEKVLGLSGTAGVPCTTLPSGSSWYSVVNDSLSSSAPWNTAAANIDYKWVRITLKGNNMTPIAVNGNTSDSRQVCWDGAHQVAMPGGYGVSCAPNGSLASITVTNPGTGFTSAPSVTIAAPPSGGTQATATANLGPISTGQVASVTMTTGGYYSSTPSITFVGGGGTGAAATATWSAPGLPVSSLTFGSSGTQCYSVAPSVAITGTGNGATATSTLSGTQSCIASWNPSAHCNALKNTSVSAVALGGPGSGFTGTLVFDNGGHVGSTTIETAGTGYTSAPTTASNATLTANSCTVTPNPTLGYLVTGVTLTNGGSGFTSTPTVSIGTGAGSSGTTPTATAVTGGGSGNGSVTSVVITNPGSGYITAPTIVFGSGTGGAIATVNMGTTNIVSSVTINNAGAGYTSAPAVTLSGGGGAGATGTALLGTGSSYGKVYLLTALAVSGGGARAMSQMEVATTVTGMTFAAPLAIAGPSPAIGALPDSSGFVISGHDANSCGGSPVSDLPAVGGYDDPNANPTTHSVSTITGAIPSGRTGNYQGSGGTPAVTNIYGGLGDTLSTPTGMKSLLDAVKAAPGANVYSNDPHSIAKGSSASPVVDYVEGNLTYGGDGYGILAVTGTLSFNGNFSWHGLVLVIGDGNVDFSGGGNGQFIGSIIVAKIWDNYTNKNLLSSLGSPALTWNGGGGNGIQYDHCWADNMMSLVPFTAPPSGNPLKVLAGRTLSY